VRKGERGGEEERGGGREREKSGRDAARIYPGKSPFNPLFLLPVRSPWAPQLRFALEKLLPWGGVDCS